MRRRAYEDDEWRCSPWSALWRPASALQRGLLQVRPGPQLRAKGGGVRLDHPQMLANATDWIRLNREPLRVL